MAAATVRSGRFPVSTTVSVYPTQNRIDGQAPSGSAVTSGVVAGDFSVSFSGLVDGTMYVAYANVGGEHRYVGFGTPAASAVAGAEVAGRGWQANTAYEAGDLITYAGALYRANADFTSGGAFDGANWTAVTTGGGGGAGLTATAVKTAAYTAADGDLVIADATTLAFTVTLPAVAAGARVGVKRINPGTQAVTVARAGSALIDGDTQVTLNAPWAAVTVTCNGADWFIE